MKRTFGILLFTLLVACSSTKPTLPQVNFAWTSDLAAAKVSAKDENKLVLLEFSTEWCTYCRHIEQRIMPQTDVAVELHKMVLVRLDGDLAATGPLMDQYKIEGYPTFLLLNSADEELARFSSVSSKEEFLQYLAKAHQADPKAKNVLEQEQDLISQIDASEDSAQKIELAQKALQLYPRSNELPYYYAMLAKSFHSNALRRGYWLQVQKIVRERLNRLDRQSEAVVRVTLDEHVDLLAEAYQELLQYDEVQPLYAEAARACEQLIERSGGIKDNQYLVGITVYFYLQSGNQKRALHFVRETAKALPSYWPVHAAFGKVYAAKKDFIKARESYAKAYVLAEEVAKTRVGLAWADVCVLQQDFAAAFEILSMTQKDIEKFGAVEAGRAKQMLEKIEKQRKEYEQVQQLGV